MGVNRNCEKCDFNHMCLVKDADHCPFDNPMTYIGEPVEPESNIPNSCEECPYTFKVKRKYGYTTHCEKEPTNMDVTHVDKGTRDAFCPLESEV